MKEKKRILFVGAGQQQLHAIKHAKSKGYQCFTLDGDDQAAGFECSDGYAIGDIRDPNFVIQSALEFNVDGIVVISTDIPVVAAAKACQELGFASVSPHSAEVSVNKFLQRHLMRDAGLLTPNFKKFHDQLSFEASISEIGFPCVVKPVDGSGSRGVTLVQGKNDLNAAMHSALANSKIGQGLIEKFVEGPEIAVDGFVINGQLRIIAISDKLRSKGSYLVDTEVLFPSILEASDKLNVQKIAQKAVSVCGLDNCPVHIEIIKSINGLVIVELAARGAGFNIFSHILPFVSGVDTISTQIRLALGQRDEVLPEFCERSAVISFIHARPGVVISLLGVEEVASIPGVEEVSIYVNVGDVVNELKSGSDRIGHILIFSNSREESDIVLKRAKLALKVITENNKC